MKGGRGRPHHNETDICRLLFFLPRDSPLSGADPEPDVLHSVRAPKSQIMRRLSLRPFIHPSRTRVPNKSRLHLQPMRP